MKSVKILLALLSLAGAAFMATGCASTQVAVDSKTHSTADYRNGVLYGKANGRVDKVFVAANKAIDKLQYFRTTGDELAKSMTQKVGARAKGDIKIDITLEEKVPGTTDIRVAYGSGDSAKSQEILNAIYAAM